ncbi:MAG: hypothetical protein ABW072_04865 [Sedimenticola sp.]
MQPSTYLQVQECEIPADCFNRLNRIRQQSGGYLDFGMPGLGDNLMILRGHHWQVWNRRLNTLLMSWDDFRNGERKSLADPVKCTMRVHHSYGRTIIHHINDSIRGFCDGFASRDETAMGMVVQFPVQLVAANN